MFPILLQEEGVDGFAEVLLWHALPHLLLELLAYRVHGGVVEIRGSKYLSHPANPRAARGVVLVRVLVRISRGVGGSSGI